MKFLRYIWRALFGETKEQERYEKGGSIAEVKKDVIDNKPLIDIPNGDDFFVSNYLTEKEKKTDSEFANLSKKEKTELKKKSKKKSKTSVVGQKTLSKIKEHFLLHKSLDVLTCKEKYKVKSLRNFIWELRRQGFVFKTEKINVINVLGENVEVINYILIRTK